MVLHAHFKKHIIALGGWLLMYTSGPPPWFGKRPHFFRIFFFVTFPYYGWLDGIGFIGSPGRVRYK